MKTKPFTHQVTGVELLKDNPRHYALGCEQGTGKSWMVLADAEYQFGGGDIDGLLIIAPNGVAANWILREIPTHLEVPHVARYWVSGAGVRFTRNLNKVLKAEKDELAIFAINIDAVNTKKGFEFCRDFLKKYRCMMVVDESQRIKTPSAKRTKRVHVLGEFAKSKRIASGTLVANSPIDLFSQFHFLAPNLLGTTSYRSFVAEFSQLLPPHNPLVQNIRARAPYSNPQIVERDINGNPIYRNLRKLAALMSPHTYRVTKEECLDLPEKIYQTHFFRLTPPQRKLYDTMAQEMRYMRDDGQVDIFTALTMISKLQQVTSGFIMVDGEATELPESGPRIKALEDLMEDIEGSVIIWARFRAEIKQIAALFPEAVTYYGDTSRKEREEAVNNFQNKTARIFIANPAAGGTGLTLTAAQTVIYYSCSFSLEHRVQSEDRCHRIGTRHPVVYIDMVAQDTVDERVANALQTKQATAKEIMEHV